MHKVVRTTVVTAVLAIGAVVGCGDGRDADVSDEAASGARHETPAEPTDTHASAEPTQETTPDTGVDLHVTISNGEVRPAPDRVSVNLGENIRIEISSDQADELHLHGYDVVAEVTPTEPAVLEFTAEQVGRFELEAHDLGLQLLQLVVE